MNLPFFKKNKPSGPKVAVGLSGGVDSAVTTHLLKEQGYDVTGVYIKCWDKKGDGCTAEDDRTDAARVSAHLEIPFKSLNFVKEYKQEVINYFYNEYKAGRTPNPDILCNKEIKFGMFLDWAMKKGFDYIATGHYARVEEKEGKYFLKRGVDKGKDQSYFLYLLGQEELSKSLFPLGNKKKEEVRRIAKEVGFHNAKKPDSMGICFIGEVDIKEFLSRRIDEHEGKVVDMNGETIGTHKGIEFYTIGQRRGFSVDKYQGHPLYIVKKDKDKNQLIVGSYEDCKRDEFDVEDLHWINEKPSKKEFECLVRVRNLGELISAEVEFEDDNKVEVELKEKMFSIAPGQSAVFYKEDTVIGGGVILR